MIVGIQLLVVVAFFHRILVDTPAGRQGNVDRVNVPH